MVGWKKINLYMTAIYLHRAQIWVSQYLCVTLTPLSQLLSDKAAPSVLLCSGEIWHCSPKVLLPLNEINNVCCLSFPLQVIPCDLSVTCNSRALSQAFIQRSYRNILAIQYQYASHFSANKALPNIVSHLNLMPIRQNSYSHYNYISITITTL